MKLTISNYVKNSNEKYTISGAGNGLGKKICVRHICVNEMGEDACIFTVEVIKVSLCSVSPFQKRRRKKI